MSQIHPGIPLVDLHRHLEGSIRLETILELGRKHNLDLPAWDVEGLRPFVQVNSAQPGVMAFIEKFEWMTAVLVDEEACNRVARENVEDLQREGIHYAELRYSPWFMAEKHTLRMEAIIDAVSSGARAACEQTGMKVNFIGIISRTYGPDTGRKELEAILSRRDFFAGVDLAGDEANWPGELFMPHFETIRDAGLHVTVHAGESAGPESIWQAILGLGAERIGHAVRALDDLALIDYLKENGIGVEANLTSNVQTSTVKNYASHPLRRFLDAGIKATINTDDPGISGIDLRHEYEIAAPAAGLSTNQIHQAQRNAVEVSFLSEDEKTALYNFVQ